MADMTPVDPTSPWMKAWTAYKTTDAFANSKRRALVRTSGSNLEGEYVDGALWAAFVHGFEAHAKWLDRPRIVIRNPQLPGTEELA